MSLCNHTQFSRDSYFDGVDCVQYMYIWGNPIGNELLCMVMSISVKQFWQKSKPQTQQILDLIRNQQKNTNSNIKLKKK